MELVVYSRYQRLMEPDDFNKLKAFYRFDSKIAISRYSVELASENYE